jgi:hypothetical protein
MFTVDFARGRLLVCLAWLVFGRAQGAGLNWPTNQFLPTFAPPAAVLDCLDLSSASSAEQDLFASLEGIVNRTQPRVVCVSSSFAEGEFTWLAEHHLPYLTTNRYLALLKYETNVTGLVVTDTNQPDTLNLATTLAGLNNELICDPSLLPTLTSAPYHLAIKDDLRGKFTTKYQVYNYLYTNCWPLCTHRIFAGLETNLHGELRDYLVAVKSATVWLDPGVAADASALQPFISKMTPVNGIYLGWWPDEAAGLQWIGPYGIPVIASDWFNNGSVFGGVTTPIALPAIPPAPPLQNKVYVSVTISDGDNIQYMQHYMKVNWGSAARGRAPIGWTAQPLAVLMDPGLLNYYWSTATTNDCLVSGPSGAGYTRINYWNSSDVNAYTRASRAYLEPSGIRAITVWNTLTAATADAYAANCPSLLGLNDQDDGAYAANDNGLPVIGFPGNNSYTSTEALLYSGITNSAAGWSGTAPLFIAVQGDGWDITPADCQTLKNSLNPSEYVMVRPDHLFLLYRQAAGMGVAAARPYVAAEPEGTVANVGTNITFSVIASGSAPLSYQWRLNGTNLTGATNTFYTKKNIQPPDAGNYSVVITNVAGGAISSNAALIVTVLSTNAPSVMSQLPTQIGPFSATMNAAVVANGTITTAWFEWGTNLDYGWQAPANALGNAFQMTEVSATITNLIPGGIYHFRCDASNALGWVRGSDEIFSTGGRVKVWGDNTYGQTNLPPGLTNGVAVACGGYHSLALKNDGTVAAWGYNQFGQANAPATLTNAIGVAAGYFHSLALKADGTLAGWGGNNNGQLDDVSNLTGVIAIAAGAYHSLALKNDGTVLAWGYNNEGQTNVPPGLNNAAGVAAGLYSSLALTVGGTVTAWGDNSFGEAKVPAGLSNVVAISTGAYHCLALRTDGTVVAWGRNDSGQTNVPPNLTNVAAIAAGAYFSLALQADGTLVFWGDNSEGQADPPAGLTNLVQACAGVYHTVAIGDFAPQAVNQTANGYVNHDLPITLSATPGDGDILIYRVTAPPGLGTLYQFANGSRGNTITLLDPEVADAAGRVLFAPGTNAFGNPYDDFDFVVNDGLNDSLSAVVTVSIGLPASPSAQHALPASGPAGTFGLVFEGTANATYSIWASTNLATWDWLGPVPEVSPGNYQFLDTLATNWPERFYRTTAP